MNQILKLSFVLVLAILLLPGLSSAASDQAKKACTQKYKSSSDSYYNCVAGYDLGKSKKSKNTEVKLWTLDGGGNKILLTSKCSAVPTCAEGHSLGGKDRSSTKASSDTDSSKKTSSPTPKAVGKAAADAGKTKKDACSRYKNESNKKQCEKAYDTQAQAKKKKESAEAAKAKEEAESKDPALDCINNRDRCNLIKKYINPIIAFLTAAVGIAVTIGIISGGIRYASAGDDPGKMNAAKKQIGTALVALFALLVLYAAIRWITPNIT